MPHDVTERDLCTGQPQMKAESGEGFYGKFNFITTERESESCYDTACYDREWGGDRQTAIRQVKKREGRSQCGIAVMCEAVLILVEGHRVLSGKKPSTIFCAMQFRWTGSPCPHLSWHLCKIMRWGVQSCLEAAVHQERLWQVLRFFFFTLFIKQLLGTHIRHCAIWYILYWNTLLYTHCICLLVMYVRFSLRATICTWCALLYYLITNIHTTLPFTVFYTGFTK